MAVALDSKQLRTFGFLAALVVFALEFALLLRRDAGDGAEFAGAASSPEGAAASTGTSRANDEAPKDTSSACAPAVFTGGVQFSDVAHFELVDLCIEGAPDNGLNIDDAGSFETPSHHVTLLRVAVRDCGGRANHDGIKLSGVRDFRLEGCTVERWGRGGSAVGMVGCCC